MGPSKASFPMKISIRTLQGSDEATTPYSSQENSIVERKFREIRRHLGHLARADRTLPWSSRIKAVQRIINSNSGSTGVSAADLKFGKNHVLAHNLLVPTSQPSEKTESERDFVTKLQEVHRQLSNTIASELKERGRRKPISDSQPVFSRGE